MSLQVGSADCLKVRATSLRVFCVFCGYLLPIIYIEVVVAHVLNLAIDCHALERQLILGPVKAVDRDKQIDDSSRTRLLRAKILLCPDPFPLRRSELNMEGLVFIRSLQADLKVGQPRAWWNYQLRVIVSATRDAWEKEK